MKIALLLMVIFTSFTWARDPGWIKQQEIWYDGCNSWIHKGNGIWIFTTISCPEKEITIPEGVVKAYPEDLFPTDNTVKSKKAGGRRAKK
jgi:hypothetical protein